MSPKRVTWQPINLYCRIPEITLSKQKPRIFILCYFLINFFDYFCTFFHCLNDLIKLILEAFHQTPNNNHHLINGLSAVAQDYPPEHLIWYRKLHFLLIAIQSQTIAVAAIIAEVELTRSFQLMTINFTIPHSMIKMAVEINLLVNANEYHVV